MAQAKFIRWFETLTRHDTPVVGGKNASLGEMIQNLSNYGIKVPPGFATSANAFRRYVAENALGPTIETEIEKFHAGRTTLSEAGAAIRSAFLAGEWPSAISKEILAAFEALNKRDGAGEAGVAVRSSATAEDLPDASFAGQQETYLNIRGEAELLDACKRCFASLFTNRAIAYREAKGFKHQEIALSVGVQRMIRSDRAGAGVMFSIDPESGFDKVVVINAAWGLGETVVQGSIEPDEYQVFKPLLGRADLAPIIERRCGTKCSKLIYADNRSETMSRPTSREERNRLVLSDVEILSLARWAEVVERHYGCPMDMEWAKDGPDGALFIVQARPETVRSREGAGEFKKYSVVSKGRVLAKGLAIGSSVAAGPVCLIESAADIERFVDGSVLVTSTTDPDWVPVMKRAAAIVTDHGGRTSHAAIVSRELGIPAIVGCGNASQALAGMGDITVDCSIGDQGFVYQGRSQIDETHIDLSAIPKTRTKVMLNLADPAGANRWWKLPADGIGLVRMEFVIASLIKAHPMALLHLDRVSDKSDRRQIERMTSRYPSGAEYFIDCLARGLSRIAAVRFPEPAIIRFSDFKTNEYADLVGGRHFEPTEENPMIGFRGASRYVSPLYSEAFELECRAIQRLRGELGFTNVAVMVPFCRTLDEADAVLAAMARFGLEKGRDGLDVLVMCEVPSNVVLARDFAKRFAGFSIGSNDLTQLTLGIDRDSELLADQFDARDPAVMWMIRYAIEQAHAAGRPVGLCGQAPSDYPDYARFLVECGIDSISVTPDSFVAVKEHVARFEADQKVPEIAE